MDIGMYRSFVTIVESGSLTQASRILHIAQPALTRHLKILQEKYGTPLVKTGQGQRHVEITPAGLVLYRKAKYFIALEDQIAEDISACKAGTSGILRITVSPSLTARLVSSFLEPFRRENPDVSFELLEDAAEEQSRYLLSGTAELGISNAAVQRSDLFFIHRVEENRMAVYLNRSNPVLKKLELIPGKDTATDFPMDRFRLLAEELPLAVTKSYSEAILSFCAEQSAPVKVLSNSTTKVTALRWAECSEAAAIAPFTTMDDAAPNLAAFLLPSRLSSFYTLYSVKDRQLSPLALRFIDFLVSTDGTHLL